MTSAVFLNVNIVNETSLWSTEYKIQSRAVLISILKDFRNAPFYIHRLLYMADLRMFPLSFLSAYPMDIDLP